MRYKIPRYIDYEAKILGPANFHQFIIIFIGMLFIGLLYLIIESLFIFLSISLIIAITIGVFTFGKINGQPFPKMISKYITFNFSGSKTYLWKKKDLAPKMIKRKKEEKKEEEVEESPFSSKQKKGRLENISKKLEI